jgi:TPR repeat protein
MPALKRSAALIFLPALLWMPQASAQQQQQQQQQQQNSAAAPASVTVTGQRQAADVSEFLAAKSRVLGRKYASSCNFMSAYNPNEDDIVLNYMRDFNLTADGANPIASSSAAGPEVLRDSSPYGDAQSGAYNTMPVTGEGTETDRPDPTAPSVKCSGADRAFASGRNYIARKDKTLERAIAAYEKGDYKEAMTQFRENYNKLGYDIAALAIGKMTLQGLGTPADTAQAVTWLRKVTDARFSPTDRMRFDPRDPSAMSERAEAAMLLAKLHLAGVGVRKDARAARDYYELAADAGYVPATSMLGLGYLSGFAGDRNPSKAVKYLKEAAEAGYVPAMYQLGKVYYNGDDGVAKDLKLAGAWFAAAAKQGHAGAQYAAGRMYDLGESVAPDQKRAIAFYREAAVKGVPAAQNALATYFYTGEVVEKNLATARKLFNAAAMGGQRDAMFNLGVMTGSGEGGPKDLSTAYVWYSLAAASGHPNAGAALKEVAPRLSKEELAKADAILKPSQTALVK